MFGCRSISAVCQNNQTLVRCSVRYVRAFWEQRYYKDLYHRRVLCGSDPLLHRSAYPNWDYDSEIFAFGHRIGAPNTASNDIVRALTDQSFFTRADIVERTVGAQPSKTVISANEEHNLNLISQGEKILFYVVLGYLRYAMPLAPEEFIQAVCSKMTSEEALTNIAKHLGFNDIVRTAEFPPNNASLTKSYKALLAVMDQKRAETLVINTVIPQVLDIDFVEVYPLKDPLAVVIDILHNKGSKEVKPRIMHCAGEVSAEPIYLVGIFADGVLEGKSAGETIPVAVDMAARDALLNFWHLSSEYAIPLGARAHVISFDKFQSPNHSLKETCRKETDLSTSAFDQKDPLDVGEVAQRYWSEVLPEAGQPLRKKLRHKFSRGSTFRRSMKTLLKPRPYTVC